MHASQSSSSDRAHERVAARESAFGVVELIVAMIIIAILMAVMISSFSGAKEATRNKEAHAVGAAYEDAIAKFQADNGNKVPVAGDMHPGFGGKPTGPKSLADPARPYLAPIPDGVIAGRVTVTMTAGTGCTATPSAPPGPATATGWVSYCPEADPAYGIRVATRKSSNSPWTVAGGAKVCWRGNTVRQPRCGG